MKSNHIAKGGIFAALSLILLYISSVIPTNRLSVLCIASCIIPLSIMLTGVKNTVVVYGAVSLLSLFIIPSKLIGLSYILIFGSYGFVKYYVEKLRNIPIEIILKLLYFNITSGIIVFIYKMLFLKIPNININVYLLLIIVEVGFVVYDYALTAFISYANKNLLKKFK
ncbi:hypothetical protein LL033_12915 [Clostridium estertheticum]|uniref:hypothetical protein n=1 Tax=Clostridium estertheticum TaxID=238834 RepID=UPI001C0DA7F1|nr:hypothetical protein [Clostridium estertheticum]MBU3213694.1 hypothetical protein [Clostridium estertheticum]WAG53587.1 hypothetical protein LL033_12915 [Clostridium estertheticum]